MLYTNYVRAPGLSSWYTLEVGMKVKYFIIFIIRKLVFFVVVSVPNKFLMAMVTLDFIVELNLSNLSLPSSSLLVCMFLLIYTLNKYYGLCHAESRNINIITNSSLKC